MLSRLSAVEKNREIIGAIDFLLQNEKYKVVHIQGATSFRSTRKAFSVLLETGTKAWKTQKLK
jgi:hypothetical protein